MWNEDDPLIKGEALHNDSLFLLLFIQLGPAKR